MYMYIYVCIYIYMYTCLYVHMYMYIYISYMSHAQNIIPEVLGIQQNDGYMEVS